MAPDGGIPQGPPVANEYGLRVLNSLDNFAGELKGVKDQITTLDKSVQEVRIKTEVIDSKLTQIKEISDHNSKRVELILEREADIKASLGSMGMKANLNLAGILGVAVAIFVMFNNMISAINNGRSAGSNTPTNSRAER